MTSSRSEGSANGDQLATAVFRLTHYFHWKAQRAGEWHFEGTVSSQRTLKKGRLLSLEPYSDCCLSYGLRGPGIKVGLEGWGSCCF